MTDTGPTSSRLVRDDASKSEIPDRLVWVLIWALIVATVVVILTVGTLLVQETADAFRDLWVIVAVALAGWCTYLTVQVRRLQAKHDPAKPELRFRL